MEILSAATFFWIYLEVYKLLSIWGVKLEWFLSLDLVSYSSSRTTHCNE